MKNKSEDTLADTIFHMLMISVAQNKNGAAVQRQSKKQRDFFRPQHHVLVSEDEGRFETHISKVRVPLGVSDIMTRCPCGKSYPQYDCQAVPWSNQSKI